MKRREARLRQVAYFDDNDEMVMTKIDVTKHETLPDGYKFVNLDEPLATTKVTRDLTGDKFVSNLEQVNKKRVEEEQSNSTEQRLASK